MYEVYEQTWTDNRVSVHRNKMDIGEFAKNQKPEPVRYGLAKSVRANAALVKELEGTLGKWK
jgi:hypothetical protein